MKRFWKKTEGFTLVELIVVIAILGILAGVGTVGYSGYIAKANKAADEVLLRNLNTAFAAACIENGEDNTKVTASDITVPADGSVGDGILDVTAPTAKAADIEASFGDYFEGGKFEVFTALTYSNGMFTADVALTFTSGKYSISLSQAQIDAIRDSAYADMGAVEMTTLLNDLSAWAGAPGVNLAQFAGDNFANAMVSYLGLNSVEEMRTYMSTKSAEETAKITSNAIVLYAAQSSSGLTTDNLTALMGTLSGSTVESVTEDLPKNASTLAQVSAIYGLYTAYAHENNIEGETGAIDVLINASKDPEFGEWLTEENGQKNAEAYLSSMSVIGSNANNSDTATNLLNNGYADEELVTLMTEILGKR